MQASLNADVANSQWIVDSYAAWCLRGCCWRAGRLRIRFGGATRTFTLGLVFFTVSSVLCGAAPTLAFLIGARVLQGLGAAMLLPASLAGAAVLHAIPGRGAAVEGAGDVGGVRIFGAGGGAGVWGDPDSTTGVAIDFLDQFTGGAAGDLFCVDFDAGQWAGASAGF